VGKNEFAALLGFLNLSNDKVAEFMDTTVDILANYRYGRTKIPDNIAKDIWDLAESKAETIDISIKKCR